MNPQPTEQQTKDSSLVSGKPTWEQLDEMHTKALGYIAEWRGRAEKAEADVASITQIKDAALDMQFGAIQNLSADLAKEREKSAVLQSQVDNADVNLEQVRSIWKSRTEKAEAELAAAQEKIAELEHDSNGYRQSWEEAKVEAIQKGNELTSLRSALAASQEREGKLREALAEKCRDIGMLLGMSKDGDWEEWKRLADKCEKMPALSTPSDAGRGGHLREKSDECPFEVPAFKAIRKPSKYLMYWWSWHPNYPYWSKSCWGGNTVEEAVQTIESPFCSSMHYYHNVLVREDDNTLVRDLPCQRMDIWKEIAEKSTHQPPPASAEESLG